MFIDLLVNLLMFFQNWYPRPSLIAIFNSEAVTDHEKLASKELRMKKSFFPPTLAKPGASAHLISQAWTVVPGENSPINTETTGCYIWQIFDLRTLRLLLPQINKNHTSPIPLIVFPDDLGSIYQTGSYYQSVNRDCPQNKCLYDWKKRP